MVVAVVAVDENGTITVKIAEVVVAVVAVVVVVVMCDVCPPPSSSLCVMKWPIRFCPLIASFRDIRGEVQIRGNVGGRKK